MADIPYDGDAPMRPPSYDVFTTRDLAGPKYIPEATFVAIQDDEVIGYGRLAWMDRADGIGDHAMLAVRAALQADLQQFYAEWEAAGCPEVAAGYRGRIVTHPMLHIIRRAEKVLRSIQAGASAGPF
jgi:hypothetical protein